jgi:hypothetical protein
MFFPLMKVLDLEGFLELSYMPPNNWENRVRKPMNIYALFSDGNRWRSELFSEIEFGETQQITTKMVSPNFLGTGLCLFYPTTENLASELEELPKAAYWAASVPEWRATSGLFNEKAQTSYQAEIYPLPSQASMLTFHPFIQFSKVENYLLVINVISKPDVTEHEIEIFNSSNLKHIGVSRAFTNSVSIIPLNQYGFTSNDLPIFLSRKMAGIPFGLGVAQDKSMLSLEHTHPPASLVLFGNRNQIQSRIKKSWLKRIDARI